MNTPRFRHRATVVSVCLIWAAIGFAHADEVDPDGWQVLASAAPDGVGAVANPSAISAPPADTAAPTISSPAAAGAKPAIAMPTTPALSPASEEVVAMPAADAFSLVAGQSLQMQLAAWAKRAGWSVAWNLPDDFIVPGGRTYTSDFMASITRVVETLAANGADVRADIWTGNRSVVIHQNGATQ